MTVAKRKADARRSEVVWIWKEGKLILDAGRVKGGKEKTLGYVEGINTML